MITKDLITIFSADTFLVGIKSNSNVSNSEEPSMYKINIAKGTTDPRVEFISQVPHNS